ncbi:ATP-binding protein [Nonomuraea guangzhouensis]|uniref:AAA family ATPase n=1 Tax=Nonomuraea guangzhouensis TaxID=1291555 RepID=A0ABW4GUJ0_9ACTN|nr:ATP-binding protein [Nonomuraea guangzhouensis]
MVTDALQRTQDNLAIAIEERAMACMHGGAGLGKTLSVNASLRELAPADTIRVQFRSHPYPRDIRGVLFDALELPGLKPSHPLEFDTLLKKTLSERFRVLVCDEAQWLSTECFELWRHLWDDPDTDIAIIFVGGANCYKVLQREPMLASRVLLWQKFERLTPAEVMTVMPVYHPIWAEADLEILLQANRHAGHGNFRAWARVTVLAVRALKHLQRTTVDEEVLAWVLDKLGGQDAA